MCDREELRLIVLLKEACNLQCAVEYYKDHSSRGSLSGTYLCFRITPAEGARLVLTRVTGSLQQREPVLYLPVLQDHSSRGSPSCITERLRQRELVLRLPVSTDSLQEKESLFYLPGYTSTLASEVRSGGLGLFQLDLARAKTCRSVVVLK
ncbi:hypothetical protein EOD39_11917 [Acipenser ruthenus]|uniref:Uncharacterized protein n=1 Tax=Acipenser ruthenus TaxID=7906 RepID=A0A662YT09_ACIRT|nr:hypothetical protein EOD39_11917 [Acipenser ruthenus]